MSHRLEVEQIVFPFVVEQRALAQEPAVAAALGGAHADRGEAGGQRPLGPRSPGNAAPRRGRPGAARAGRPHRQHRPDGQAVAQPEALEAATKRRRRPVIGVRHHGREVKARLADLADMRQGDPPFLAKAHALGNPRLSPPHGIGEPVRLKRIELSTFVQVRNFGSSRTRDWI